MTVANGEVVRIAARCKRGDEADVINVFHAVAVFTAPQADADVLSNVASWMDLAYNYVESYIPAGQYPVDIKVDVIDLVAGVVTVIRNVGTTVWPGSYVPGATGEYLPRAVAGLVFLLTAVGKVFGRKYIGCLSEAAVNGDNIVSGLATALNNWMGVILAGRQISAGNSLTSGILSTRTLAFEEFTSGRVRGLVGYQRRRAPGVGS